MHIRPDRDTRRNAHAAGPPAIERLSPAQRESAGVLHARPLGPHRSLSGITRHDDACLLEKLERQRACPPGIGARLIDRTRGFLCVVLEGGDAARRPPITALATQGQKPVWASSGEQACARAGSSTHQHHPRRD